MNVMNISGDDLPECPTMEATGMIKTERDVIESEQESQIGPNPDILYIEKLMSSLDIQTVDQNFANRRGSRKAELELLKESVLLSKLVSIIIRKVEPGKCPTHIEAGMFSNIKRLMLVNQEKLIDFYCSRKTEEDELLNDSTAESFRQAAGVVPSIPARHDSIGTPSACPPPPVTQNQLSASADRYFIQAQEISTQISQLMATMPLKLNSNDMRKFIEDSFKRDNEKLDEVQRRLNEEPREEPNALLAEFYEIWKLMTIVTVFIKFSRRENND